MRSLPIGISSLGNIITQGCIYIDKTRHIANLVKSGTYYFLSRPRRFGKSLLIDTLKQAFLGRQELFKGLYLEYNWDWTVIYPVIHLSFGGSSAYKSNETLQAIIKNTLSVHAKDYLVILDLTNLGVAFDQLIKALFIKYQQRVVILVDEYDKPILDVISDMKQADLNRESLKGLYSIIKDNDIYIKFVLLTGVSKFSKVSLFSGLNNLSDITLDSRYADICGYTQSELEAGFAEELLGVDKSELKRWYNGYNFAGSEVQKVYNPYDILLFFDKGKAYRNYWFETATPTFLIKLLQQQKYYLPQLEGMVVSEDLLNSFDIEKIQLETLLFQSGYLTIAETVTNPFDVTLSYRMGYPNFEVRKSLTSSLIEYFIDDKGLLSNTRLNLIDALVKQDFKRLQQGLTGLFAGIPYNWYVNNNIAEYEGFYATVIYSIFNSLGLVTIPEDSTNKGRIDLTIDVLAYKIILEFKLSGQGDAAGALEQIKRKDYAAKYHCENKPIYLVGISFDRGERNIKDFRWEEYIAPADVELG